MKKYVKPSVKVVNLKSSNDIATTFERIKTQFTQSYLKNGVATDYTISLYSNNASVAIDAE